MNCRKQDHWPLIQERVHHMQQINGTATMTEMGTSRNNAQRERVEKVVETLATLRNESETVAEVAHDARNMVTALGLYCDLLEEPGVLAIPYTHYGHELRLVASASRHLVERLIRLDAGTNSAPQSEALRGTNSNQWPVATAAARSANRVGNMDADGRLVAEEDRNRRRDMLPAVPVANLAAELLANRNLLAALAGPSIALTVDADGGARSVRLTGEDLTRVLVNLVKNAAEAMPDGGCIHICVRERPAVDGAAACVNLTVEDSGPGIPTESLERIFISGFTTRGNGEPGTGWPLRHRGLGLAITRSIVEAAGGRICACNRAMGGACIEIELPLKRTTF